MGREVRRVPLDFDWPLNMPWKGFMCPYSSQDCAACGGEGYNPETLAIAKAWYDFDDRGVRWCHAITQDEVQALADAGRLHDFTHTFVPGKGWTPKDPPVVPTAAQVNEAYRRGLGHDAINRMICVETRATRLGVYGKCRVCHGEGSVWFSEEIKAKSERWYDEERYGPPEGDAYQLWETTSEGSPISPPKATPEELARWLADNGASSFGSSTESYETWLKFIRGPGWAPSAVSGGGRGLRSGVEGVTEDKP